MIYLDEKASNRYYIWYGVINNKKDDDEFFNYPFIVIFNKNKKLNINEPMGLGYHPIMYKALRKSVIKYNENKGNLSEEYLSDIKNEMYLISDEIYILPKKHKKLLLKYGLSRFVIPFENSLKLDNIDDIKKYCNDNDIKYESISTIAKSDSRIAIDKNKKQEILNLKTFNDQIAFKIKTV